MDKRNHKYTLNDDLNETADTCEDEEVIDRREVDKTKAEEKRYYTWLKLREYCVNRGLQHLFGLKSNEFTYWLQQEATEL